MRSPTSARHIWTFRIVFLVLSIMTILFSLLPISLASRGFPGPDLLLALTLAWLLRQPALVPVASIVLVFLAADFLFQKPPGLWTLLAVLVSESLRRRRLQMMEMPFLVEWAAVSAAIMGMIVSERIILLMLFVDLPPLGLSLAHGIVTIAIYPMIVGLSKYVFRLRKLGPAELEPL